MVKKLPTNGYILGLDVGERRIGVAVASVIARLPEPLALIEVSDSVVEDIKEVIAKNSAILVVIGIPRALDGGETAQSSSIREFADKIKQQIEQPIIFVDESLSSVRADEVAKSKSFKNVSRDSLAACFILEEYFVNSKNL